jgi:hypothetical protein
LSAGLAPNEANSDVGAGVAAAAALRQSSITQGTRIAHRPGAAAGVAAAAGAASVFCPNRPPPPNRPPAGAAGVAVVVDVSADF